MDKVLKIFLKNSKVLKGQEIYCVRLNANEDLEGLRNKVFMRCPQLRNHDPQIYWFDLENDKIRITCDDDLKFFMEESPVQKLVFDFHPDSDEEISRKRSCSELAADTECAKKIRRQLQNIDLSSDSSLMDTDDEDDNFSFTGSSSQIDSKNSSVNDVNAEPMPSTSKAALESLNQSQKVNIISVETIPPSQASETIEIADEVESNSDEIIKIDEVAAEEPRPASLLEEATQKGISALPVLEKKPEPTNRILISDSSDDEEEKQNTSNNRRPSDGPRPSASAYSFAGVTGDGETFFRTYASQSSNGRRRGRRYSHQRANSDANDRFNCYRNQQSEANDRFNQHSRNFQQAHAANMERICTNVRMARDHAASARQHAANIVRASTSAIPDLLSSFQDHFSRPLFRVADINQQIFGNMGRR